MSRLAIPLLAAFLTGAFAAIAVFAFARGFNAHGVQAAGLGMVAAAFSALTLPKESAR